MGAYVIAHVSDLHLGPIPPFLLRDWNVKRGLGVLNWHRKRKRLHSIDAWAMVLADLKASRPDHIALTGDLVNVGLPAEHEAAARWLADLGGPEEVTVVPGNHDIYTELRDDPGIERWRPYMQNDGGGQGPVGGFPVLRRRGPIAIVAMNSARPTRPFDASGRCGERQLAAAAELLAAAGAQGLFRCLLIHHPPLPGQAKRGRELRDAAALRSMLETAGVELVLHGHNHVDMVAEFACVHGPAIVSGIASGSVAAGGPDLPARYALHAVARSPTGWQLESTLKGLEESGRVTVLGQTMRELPRP
jgi:3',5'-cyclic AMP phosphodiesterase CpdA